MWLKRWRIRRLERERDRYLLAEVFWQRKCRENPDILWYKSQLRKAIRRYRMIDEQIEKLKG